MDIYIKKSTFKFYNGWKIFKNSPRGKLFVEDI